MSEHSPYAPPTSAGQSAPRLPWPPTLGFGLPHAFALGALVAWQSAEVGQRSALAAGLLRLLGEAGRDLAWGALAAMIALLLVSSARPLRRFPRLCLAAALWALIPSSWWLLADAGTGLSDGLLGWMVMYLYNLHFGALAVLLAELLATLLLRLNPPPPPTPPATPAPPPPPSP